MPEIHFSSLDLNLLRLFDVLAEERSVTRAGARLGLTQSAVSHALARLRHALQDDLFVRGPDGMRPTARARELEPRVRDALRQLNAALTADAFDPAKTRKAFTVGAGSYAASLLLPALVARLERTAPFAELRAAAVGPGVGDELLSGRLDLIIGSFGRAASGFARERLFEERLIWAVRADHPATRDGRLDLSSLAAIAHVIVAAAERSDTLEGRVYESGLERRVIWDDGGALEVALAGSGLKRRIAVSVQEAQSALAIVARSDTAALVPERLARRMAPVYRLALFSPPYPSRPLEVELMWARQRSADPAIRWLRAELSAASEGL